MEALVEELRKQKITDLYYDGLSKEEEDYKGSQIDNILRIINKYKTQLNNDKVSISSLRNKLLAYCKKLYEYSITIHSIDIMNAPEKDAITIFERLNTKGTKLTKFEVLAAQWSQVRIYIDDETLKDKIESMYKEDRYNEKTEKREQDEYFTPAELLLSIVLKTFRKSELLKNAFLEEGKNTDNWFIKKSSYDMLIWIYRTWVYAITKNKYKIKKYDNDNEIADYIQEYIVDANNNDVIYKIISSLEFAVNEINKINILQSKNDKGKYIFENISNSMLISLISQLFLQHYLNNEINLKNIINNIIYSVITNEYGSSTLQTISNSIFSKSYLEHNISLDIITKKIESLEAEQMERIGNQKGFEKTVKFIISFAYSKLLKNKQLKYDFDHIVPKSKFTDDNRKLHFGKNSIGNCGQLSVGINRGDKNDKFQPEFYAHDELINIYPKYKIDKYKKEYNKILTSVDNNFNEKNLQKLYKYRFNIIKELFISNIESY